MKVLRLHLKGTYWYQIKTGEKTLEYRKANDYWWLRLRTWYDEIHLLRGYPKKEDQSKVIRRQWVWYPPQEYLTHPEFGDKPTWVFAIDVSHEL